MTKKIYIDKRVRDDRPDKRVRTRIFKDGNEVHGRDDFQDYNHHFNSPKPPKPPKPPRPNKRHEIFISDYDVKMRTKMFTSKDDLVKYVNEIGDEGHGIDIFKIEEGLYKVVIVEKIKKEKEVFESKSKEYDLDIDEEEIEIEIEEK